MKTLPRKRGGGRGEGKSNVTNSGAQRATLTSPPALRTQSTGSQDSQLAFMLITENRCDAEMRLVNLDTCCEIVNPSCSKVAVVMLV